MLGSHERSLQVGLSSMIRLSPSGSHQAAPWNGGGHRFVPIEPPNILADPKEALEQASREASRMFRVRGIGAAAFAPNHRLTTDMP
jgi:hypothetical protein